MPPSESLKNGLSNAEVKETSKENGDLGEAFPDLQEALGVTPEGTCVRHPNCPVLSVAHSKIQSCRVCFSEEKSVGIRQRKSFAAVVQQLQQMSEPKSNGDDEKKMMGGKEEEERRRKVNRAHSASMSALVSQQPQTWDAIMKRMGQVQNWILRQKEKEVMSLQLQIQSLEEKLHDSETKNQEHMQTIWALRRTIGQDMKIIKTMAVQKERENASQNGSPVHVSASSSPAKRHGSGNESPNLFGSPDKLRLRSNSAHSADTTPMASPAGKIFMSGPNTPDPESVSGGETPEAIKGVILGNDPLLDKVRQKKKALQSKFEELRAANKNSNSVTQSASAHIPRGPDIPSLSELKRSDVGYSFRANSTRSLDEMVEPPAPDGLSSSTHGDILVEPQDARTPYWNDEEYASLTSDPSKLFKSFRGGLLDIPKSPPAASHDNRQKYRPKLQIDTDQMAALKMPRMRGVGRTLSYQSSDDLSVDGRSLDGQSLDGQSVGSHDGSRLEIPLHKLATSLESLPLSRPLGNETPEKLFEKDKPASGGSESRFEKPPPPPLLGASASSGSGPGPKQMPRKPKRTASTDGILQMVPEVHDEDEDLGSSKSNLADPASLMPAPQVPSMSGQSNTNSRPAFEGRKSNRSIQDDETAGTAGTTPTFYTEAGAALRMSREQAKQDSIDKFLFSVTSAQCQDKYGDPGVYTGTILVTEGLPQGKGCMNYDSGRVYDGAWVAGQWNGHGKLLNPNGDSYEGEFVLDARHGKGEYRWANGDIYKGDFTYDRRNGNGKFSFHNGNVYEGEFVDGMFEGFGRYEFEEGYYEGEWRQGRYHGDGELKYANGGKYMGEFRESLAHGFGVEILPDGQKRRGVWEKGEPVEFFHRPPKPSRRGSA